MSVEAFSWALKVPVGGNEKVILLGIANHAHPDGTEAYPALDTLAEYAHCERSTARRNVRKLVADGWAIPDGVGPRGQTKYRLPLDRATGSKMPPRGKRDGVASATEGGGTSAQGGVAPVPPEPSFEPTEPSIDQKRARAGASTAIVHRLPDDLPDHLQDAATVAARVLYRTAQRRGQSKAVLLEAVGHIVGQKPTKDHVDVAERIEYWLCWGKGQSKPCRDVVARFRDWLGDADDVRLPDGSPLLEPGEAGNVHPIRRGAPPTNGDLLRAVRQRQESERMTIEGTARDLG